MPKFAIDMPHNPQQCSAIMDDMADQNSPVLSQSFWGCMHGNHEGWAIVDAANRDDALNMVPEDIRNSARVTEVDQFSVAQIEQMHRAA